MPDYSDIITKHAQRVGVDPAWLKKIMKIESGGDPNNVTGRYQGLFQLSEKEFKAHGGSGNIKDPEQNTMAAANKLAKESLAFKQKYGRDPKLADLYMIHQQGEGGYAAHMANPDQPAWKSMLSTGEGKQKGEAWAKAAIWGNIPDKDKAKFGSVDNVTSKQFTEYWGSRIEGGQFESYGPFKAAKTTESDRSVSRATFLGGKEPEPMRPVKSDPIEPIDLNVADIVPQFNLGRMRVPTS